MSIDYSGSFPKLRFKDKESYKNTKEYDDQAMRYLGYALYPLIVGYALYSLMYEDHKGWYFY